MATSFLGVALGLFDFLTDLLKIDNSIAGRSKIALLTFVPPMIGGVLFPNGFIYAIGYAGFAAAVFALFTPVALAFQARAKLPETEFVVTGGHLRMLVVIIFAICVVIFQVLSMLGLIA